MESSSPHKSRAFSCSTPSFVNPNAGARLGAHGIGQPIGRPSVHRHDAATSRQAPRHDLTMINDATRPGAATPLPDRWGAERTTEPTRAGTCRTPLLHAGTT